MGIENSSKLESLKLESYLLAPDFKLKNFKH
jgi:hypothetical protein